MILPPPNLLNFILTLSKLNHINKFKASLDHLNLLHFSKIFDLLHSNFLFPPQLYTKILLIKKLMFNLYSYHEIIKLLNFSKLLSI